jgi:hypothetical protein
MNETQESLDAKLDEIKKFFQEQLVLLLPRAIHEVKVYVGDSLYSIDRHRVELTEEYMETYKFGLIVDGLIGLQLRSITRIYQLSEFGDEARDRCLFGLYVDFFHIVQGCESTLQTLKTFTCTDHDNVWTGVASVVRAYNEDHARELLDEELIEENLKPNDYTLIKVDEYPHAIILQNGDY